MFVRKESINYKHYLNSQQYENNQLEKRTLKVISKNIFIILNTQFPSHYSLPEKEKSPTTNDDYSRLNASATAITKHSIIPPQSKINNVYCYPWIEKKK